MLCALHVVRKRCPIRSSSFILHFLLWSLSDSMMAMGSWLPIRRHTLSRAVFGLKLQLAMSSTLAIDLGPRSTGLFATLEIQCFPTRSVQCFLSGDFDRAFPNAFR